ncbi:MAG: hypothetical protein KIT66_11165 [Chitinophagaceae bacterium]|nr:hypothetical protein [Chitinophagaceae bacterium]
MKLRIIAVVITSAFTIISCSTEKPIASTSQNALFSEELTQTNMLGLSAASREDDSRFMKDMLINKIPFTNPQERYATWQLYLGMVVSKNDNISPFTRQFCATQLLDNYVNAANVGEKKLVPVVKSELKLLIDNEYKNYRLLYKNLEWLKQSGEKGFVRESRDRILAYASPLNNPSAKSDSRYSANLQPSADEQSKELVRSKEFQKMTSMIDEQMKLNDSYITRLKTL